MHSRYRQQTCNNIGEFHPVDQFICSKCGIWIEDWVKVVIDDDFDPPERFLYEYEFKFCPECGDKIIDENWENRAENEYELELAEYLRIKIKYNL